MAVSWCERCGRRMRPAWELLAGFVCPDCAKAAGHIEGEKGEVEMSNVQVFEVIVLDLGDEDAPAFVGDILRPAVYSSELVARRAGERRAMELLIPAESTEIRVRPFC